MKDKLNKKLSYRQRQLDTALGDFLKTNKRQDRDRVLRLQTRIKVYNELLKDL